jgi:hypothetical protein
MKTLNLLTLNKNIKETPLNDITTIISELSVPFIKVDCINWKEFDYKPSVAVRLAHFNDGLFLHFNVNESNIRALVDADNGPVYTDSCVEFFIDPLGNGTYYNFEFNCTGYLLLGFGSGRHNREMASLEILQSVKRVSSLGEKPFELLQDNINWELEVFIPFSSFFKHKITALKEQNPTCNIYKCGDLQKTPHYISWNPIETDKPDFHRPEFFGKISLK